MGKRKTGVKRTASGRISRAGQKHDHSFDRGTPRIQELRARFDVHYSSALGRAYASGLLGEGQEANDRYDAGKQLARVRQRYFGHRSIRCPLDTSPRGLGPTILTDREVEQACKDKAWLEEIQSKMDRGCAPYLDQLLSDIHSDAGPSWLDDLLGQTPSAGADCA